jgi:hypothetical protein
MLKKAVIAAIGILVLVGLGSWAALMCRYSPALQEPWRVPTAAVVGIVILAALFAQKRRALWRTLAVLSIAICGVLWTTIKPSNDRDWSGDVAQIPWGEVQGDDVVIHNVRNFDYRTEQDFDARYEDRMVKLSQMSEVDILVTYWGSKPIAHIMVSFGFNNRDFLAISIETRKEKGEGYSTVNGFFRNYELAYVVADERDVVRLRTTYRNPEEQVYVLRTNMSLENGRKLFLDYIAKMNQLRAHPKFYNTLTTNCTTQVLEHTRAYGGKTRYNWQILLSGYVPEYLFENAALAPNLTLEDIMKLSLVNEASHAASESPDFSARIREGVPRPIP